MPSRSNLWEVGFPGAQSITGLGDQTTMPFPTPESQPGGFLAAAASDPQDFISTRISILDAQDRSRARRQTKKGYTSTRPLVTQIWR